MAQQQELLVAYLGQETTWGTEATASWVKLPGITDLSLSPAIEISDFPTLEGLAPIYNAAVVKDGGEASISGLLNYEDLPRWLNSLLGTDATPVPLPNPTTPTSWRWEYAAPHASAVSSPEMFSLYYGTATSGYQLLGAMVNTLEISGSSGEALQLSLGFVGKNVEAEATAQTATGWIQKRTITLAVASDLSVSIDSYKGTFGATEYACTAYSFSLSLTANRGLIYAMGSIVPCDTYHQRFDGTLDLTLEFPGDSDYVKDDLLDALLAGPTLIQKAIEVNVSSDAQNIIDIKFSGTLMDPPDIFTDSDGISTVDLSFKGTYDSQNGLWCDIDVTNTVPDLWT